MLVWSRLNRAAEIVRPFTAAARSFGAACASAADETADDGRGRGADDDILFRRPEIGDGDRPVRAGGGSERVVWAGNEERGQTGDLGDAFIGDHVSNFGGRFAVCKTEYLFI